MVKRYDNLCVNTCEGPGCEQWSGCSYGGKFVVMENRIAALESLNRELVKLVTEMGPHYYRCSGPCSHECGDCTIGGVLTKLKEAQ